MTVGERRKQFMEYLLNKGMDAVSAADTASILESEGLDMVNGFFYKRKLRSIYSLKDQELVWNLVVLLNESARLHKAFRYYRRFLMNESGESDQ